MVVLDPTDPARIDPVVDTGEVDDATDEGDWSDDVGSSCGRTTARGEG